MEDNIEVTHTLDVDFQDVKFAIPKDRMSVVEGDLFQWALLVVPMRWGQTLSEAVTEAHDNKTLMGTTRIVSAHGGMSGKIFIDQTFNGMIWLVKQFNKDSISRLFSFTKHEK